MSPRSTIRAALPAALHHFYMGRAWRAFLDALGASVAESGPTDRETLDLGVKGTIGDLCLPVKAYMGHVARLESKADILFVPRLVSVCASRYYCPKFLSLPDMVRARFPGLRQAVVEINAKKGRGFTRSSFQLVASSLCPDRSSFDRAMSSMDATAITGQNESERSWNAWISAPPQAPRVAVIGHPYVTGDAYVSSGVVKWLKAQGAAVATCEMVPDPLLAAADPALFRDVYWEGAWSLFRSAVHFLGRSDVDGMIFLSAFGCGPDSFISDMIGRRVRGTGSMPFARLLVDEHTAREGLVTRLEAFMDMVQTYRGRRD